MSLIEKVWLWGFRLALLSLEVFFVILVVHSLPLFWGIVYFAAVAGMLTVSFISPRAIISEGLGKWLRPITQGVGLIAGAALLAAAGSDVTVFGLGFVVAAVSIISFGTTNPYALAGWAVVAIGAYLTMLSSDPVRVALSLTTLVGGGAMVFLSDQIKGG